MTTTTAPAETGPRVRTPRRLFGLLVLAVLLSAAAMGSLAIGSRGVAATTILDALRGIDRSSYDAVVVLTGRLPRTLIGLVVGAALGLAGTVMQGVTRNPLADPGLLGVHAGAALALVGGIVLLGASSPAEYVWLAFGGAAVASVAVFLIGSRGPRGASPTSLALAGSAVTALLIGATSVLLLRSESAFDDYRRWTVGSFAGRDPAAIGSVLPYLIVGAGLALFSGRALNVMTLGEDVARALGQHVGRTQLAAGVTIVLLCGSATAIAGPIAFVGLAVPHAARLLTGPDFRWILPYAMLLAPLLLLAADIIGRLVAQPGELPVGVVTALLGAPLFIALVRRRRTAEL